MLLTHTCTCILWKLPKGKCICNEKPSALIFGSGHAKVLLHVHKPVSCTSYRQCNGKYTEGCGAKTETCTASSRLVAHCLTSIPGSV